MSAVADLFPETKPDVSPDEAFDERYTTRETIAWVLKLLRIERFDLDVAACTESHWAERYFTKSDNGLTQLWRGHVWCNPPYSDVAPWVEKAWEAIRSGDATLVAMLIPATRTEQAWWQREIEPYRDGRGRRLPGVSLTTTFLAGRTSFARPGSGGVGQSGAPFGCVLLVWRRK